VEYNKQLLASDELFSFANLYRQYLKCRKNKCNTSNALKFELKAEENIWDLAQELQTKTYTPARSICFVIEKPKMREIIAADFRDRVVHHVLIDQLEKIYEPAFIYDSYACRQQKGTHKAVNRVQNWLKQIYSGTCKQTPFVQLDIKNFFMNVDHKILYELLEKKLNKYAHFQQQHLPRVQDSIDDLLWLSRIFIFYKPTDNYILKGEKYLFENLPPHKSLFTADLGKGLAIGNHTSQFFANVYLNELDKYIKHNLKCRYYVRYCDDFIVLHQSALQLAYFKANITGFVQQKLGLKLNERYGKILSSTQGIDFLGYIIRKDYILIRRRVVHAFKQKMQDYEKKLINNESFSSENNVFSFCAIKMQICFYDYTVLESLRATLASYMGCLAHANTYNLRLSLIRNYAFMYHFFCKSTLLANNLGQLKPLYKHPQLFSTIWQQYNYFRWKFDECVLFFQVGRFYEFYAEISSHITNALGLSKITLTKRRLKYGFPVRLRSRNINILLQLGYTIIIIQEIDKYIGHIKERLPWIKVSPLT
jgi:RNA-directed DNA polymerase